MSENNKKKTEKKSCLAAGETVEFHNRRPHYIKGFFFIKTLHISKLEKKNVENKKKKNSYPDRTTTPLMQNLFARLTLLRHTTLFP